MYIVSAIFGSKLIKNAENKQFVVAIQFQNVSLKFHDICLIYNYLGNCCFLTGP